MAKSKKAPRVNKTKDQLVAEEKLKQETARKRTRVREDLYPFLKDKDLSVTEIHQLCYLMSQFVRQGFIQLQKTMKLEELKMEDVLKTDDMKDYLQLYDMFRHETVMGTLEFLDGMSQQVEQTMKANWKNTKFNSIDLQLY